MTKPETTPASAQAASKPLVEIEGLVKEFGPFRAVDGLSFSVSKGEVLGFLGPNGAGKSTTMKMITGFLAPTAGRIHVAGFDLADDLLPAQGCIGYLPEGAPAYPEMTPRQYLEFIAEIRGARGAEVAEKVETAVARTQLGAVLEQPIETLSKGFKRRVGLAQAILHDPPVLIMDEPTDGLDPNQKHAVRDLIAEMSADKAIIISTHILEEVEAVCTRAIIIDRGRIVADGTPTQLNARSRYHNAVTVVVDSDAAGRTMAVLESVTGVDIIEEVRDADGTVRLTAFPKKPEMHLAGPVGAALDADGVNVRALHAEPGRLDDVFRAVTTSDAAPESTASGAATAA
ncbi:MAG: ABC transporter ATP-binding protein [Alphaproteobacteria bacterium]